MTTDLPHDLTDEERLIVEVVDAIGAERVGPACVDADREGRLDPALSALLHEQGLLLAGVPELSDDARPLLGVLVVERLARAGGAVATLAAGAHDAAAAYEGAARGRLVDLARAEGAAATLADGTGGALTATADGSLWILEGRVPRVELPPPDGALVVLATKAGGGEVAFELPRDGASVVFGPVEPTTGLRGVPVAGIALDAVVGDERRIAGEGGVRAARTHRALSSAALCVGIGAGAHALASVYASERRQFGRALRAFPAIEGLLLDIEMQMAGAAELVWTAARLLEQRGAAAESAGRRAASASARAARFATRGAVQVHGGYGYVREQVVERSLRDAISAAARAGGTELVELASAPW